MSKYKFIGALTTRSSIILKNAREVLILIFIFMSNITPIKAAVAKVTPKTLNVNPK